MEEIAPGIWHWSATHPRIGIDVHSYYLPEERVVIDPIAPADGLRLVRGARPPDGRPAHEPAPLPLERASSSSASARPSAACARACTSSSTAEPVEPFDFDDEPVPGIVAHEVGAICPDETALHIPPAAALAIADGAVRWEPGAPLAFVPDRFMDEPEPTKEGLRASYRRLAELDFDHLLLAHGEPDRRTTAARRFARSPRRVGLRPASPSDKVSQGRSPDPLA